MTNEQKTAQMRLTLRKLQARLWKFTEHESVRMYPEELYIELAKIVNTARSEIYRISTDGENES